jgi:hypothetical protein
MGLGLAAAEAALFHGFRAQGRTIPGAGESIFPDLVRGELRLESGYDELGHYLLSCSEPGDEFLRRLAQGLE